MISHGMRLGARPLADGRCRFHVWAPRAKRVDLVLIDKREHIKPMHMSPRGYATCEVEDVSAGAQYMYRLGGTTDRPDPASRYQPLGVHGPSEVVDECFAWSDHAWHGVTLERAVFYELHVGTFSQKGTFDAAVDDLPRLRDLGVTIIELMPVAQFPGERNWGYDGAFPFAVKNSYGGPDGLRRLVDRAHGLGLGVALDVVYNHLGPEGNYLQEFGPYFTAKYHTPWGDALNFDDAQSDEVRRYFIENALMWIEDFHIDALRLDAVHAIFDQSASPFLHELTDAVHARAAELGRRALVIGESDLNDPKLVRAAAIGGWDMDATWSDDLHHALHALVSGERDGYYADYGSIRHLAQAIRTGYAFTGQYSRHRQRRHGAPAMDVPPCRHVVCAQNHDQVGNRMKGERLSATISFEQMKTAAMLILLSPFTPLIFMGEEYGEMAPFQYFVSHSDPELIDAVRDGRAREFASFGWAGEVPDPQAVETFERSKLNRALRSMPVGKAMEALYRELLVLRASITPVRSQDMHGQEFQIDEAAQTLFVSRYDRVSGECIALCFNFDAAEQRMMLPGAQRWRKLFDSADRRWNGPGSVIAESVQSREQFTMSPTSGALFSCEERESIS